MLGEAADREDVLNEISPDMLDKIAHRLYAEDEKNLSAYERLLKDDKRKKMDYLNTIRPEFAYNTEDDKNRDQSNELELSTAEQMEEQLRKTDAIHEKLTQQRDQAESDRQYTLME